MQNGGGNGGGGGGGGGGGRGLVFVYLERVQLTNEYTADARAKSRVVFCGQFSCFDVLLLFCQPKEACSVEVICPEVDARLSVFSF